MYTNPYVPYDFQPQFGFNNMPQQSQNTPSSSLYTTKNGPDWIQVSSIKQVEQVSVQPGSKAWIMVQNEPIFALRIADQMGLVTTEYYRFQKIDPKAIQPQETEYVTRKEFEKFIASLETQKKVAKKENAE